ncbi:MAG: hypothetical protein HC883_06065, partial [Bdellovibrionaceae bacterium]|nr:hypothetical protein [Pseudobdellovibrionaceae bacterium]
TGESTFLGVTPDRRIVGIACGYNLVKSAVNMEPTYNADLVFPNDSGVLDFSDYRRETAGRSANYVAKPAYRPLSVADAKTFCKEPNGEFVFHVTDQGAALMGKRSISVRSFGVGRRSL